MKRASTYRPYNAVHDFRPPAGISSAEICDATGNLAGSSCERTRNELFISGTEPTEVCDGHEGLVSPADLVVPPKSSDR
jgi:membrane carboxypeptidase/penicillin-binding protein